MQQRRALAVARGLGSVIGGALKPPIVGMVVATRASSAVEPELMTISVNVGVSARAPPREGDFWVLTEGD